MNKQAKRHQKFFTTFDTFYTLRIVFVYISIINFLPKG